jgi:hypothetical protein
LVTGITFGQGVLGAFFFLSTSTIASLSETLIKWKGFFRDALTFYHQFVREPLHQLFFDFKLDLRPEYLDFIVIYSLLFSAFIRLRFVEMQNNIPINWRLILNLFGGIFVIAMPVALGTDRFITWHIVAIQVIYILLLPLQLSPEQKRPFIFQFYSPFLLSA